MAEGEDLSLERSPTSDAFPNRRKQQENDRGHDTLNLPRRSSKFNWLNKYGVFGTDRPTEIIGEFGTPGASREWISTRATLGIRHIVSVHVGAVSSTEKKRTLTRLALHAPPSFARFKWLSRWPKGTYQRLPANMSWLAVLTSRTMR